MNVYELTVSLRVSHPTMSCDELSSNIGLTPEFSNNVGEERKNPKGVKLGGHYCKTYCCFSLEEKISGSIEDYVQKWCLHFNDQKDFFQQVKKSGGRSEFFIGIFLSGNSGFTFTAEDFSSLSSLGLDMAFDLYD